ncbi:hypothetical protein [Thermococcus sp. LS2]|uniref:hypothetical protein n=1 Tax=Thermococcus sp. LS2 TaxID=1638260 RepID=UPI00143C0676|nr:hypothetical protein [Thermococcus sp. LS2]NJE13245.1 hypothetical protein [Thermococcus sp. LS2]
MRIPYMGGTKMLPQALMLFVISWFIFVHWGLELGVGAVIMILTGSWRSQTIGIYLVKVWIINFLRLVVLYLLLNHIGVELRKLTNGRLGMRETLIVVAIIVPFIAVEVAYYGFKAYTPQMLREFDYYLRLSGSERTALVATLSAYTYYIIEILSVNALYVGTSKFIGSKRAMCFPAILWGFSHVLNVLVGFTPLQALGLALYMGSIALAMYYVAYHTGSLKVPIIAWMLLMVA